MSDLKKVNATVRYIGVHKPGLSSTRTEADELARRVLDSFLDGYRYGEAPTVLDVTVNGVVFHPDEL